MWIGIVLAFIGGALTLWLEGFGGLFITNIKLGFLTGIFLNFYLNYVDENLL
ncbi:MULTISPECIES: hypothetical protein [Bacillaceae]|uniref:hypothetical protein n=1 Tax=Bacillaceae TaxID=186817 RepID=UPI0001E895F3|nr:MULTISPECIES: hypothetical protein [Bacillaceae]